ncbi:MAG: hypothetical protein LUH07_06970 [Lachnospiraceae bacterium]|nr:hypothetical protein [Lachnospiraceae bacterium]
MTEDAYYLVSLGSVLALDLQTGELLWENADFQGCAGDETLGSAMDENGIYLAGFYGPDFIAVSYSGETLARIESFDPDYSQADVVHLLGDGTAVIRMMFGNGDDFSGFCVNLSDWTYFFVEDTSVYAEETDEVDAIIHIGDYYEYANLTAYDKYANRVWEYQTDEYSLADTSRLNEIGLHGETYYFSEYGMILALDKWTGDILWKNVSLPSGAYTYLHAFDDAGNLYGFASVQPGSDLMFFGIEADGDTIGLITDFGLSYEAVSLEISDGQAVVHLNSYEEGEVVTVIDLDTFEL